MGCGMGAGGQGTPFPGSGTGASPLHWASLLSLLSALLPSTHMTHTLHPPLLSQRLYRGFILLPQYALGYI